MEKLISVIIPVYKVEPYLDRCINSIVGQTYPYLEIILVDDGSPDQCPRICDDWADKDNRIKVIHKENGGLSSARNAGLDVATGDYISFVDSDDYISEEMFETMLSAILRNKVSVACCGRVRVSNTSKIEMFTLLKEQLLSGEEAIKELLKGGMVEEAAWDKLYRSDVFKNRRFPVGEINEDIVQTVEILGNCGHIVHVGKALYYYCENTGSITKSEYNKNKIVVLKHLDQIREYILNNFPMLMDYYMILETRYCQSMLYLLLDNSETYKTYQRDRTIFYKRFKNGFSKRFIRCYINGNEKIKGWLIFLCLYYPIHKLKKKVIR